MTRASGAGDVAAALAYFAPDAVVTDAADPGTVTTGHDAIAELLRGFLQAFPDARYEVVELEVSGERVGGAVQVRATPVATEPVEFHMCVFDVIRDGRVVSEHIYGGPPAAAVAARWR